ncbi:MAG: thioesterase family protein, partial [Polyangiaceae bacterium]
PLRYGDTARISVDVLRVGNKSATLRFTLQKASDDTHCATITHTCAVCDLEKLRAIPMPADIRAVLEANLLPS